MIIDNKNLQNETLFDDVIDSIEVNNLTVDNLFHCLGTAVFDSAFYLHNEFTTIDLAAPTTGGDYTFTFPAGPGTNGQILATNGLGETNWVSVMYVGGTVTSVDITVPSFMNITGGPITTFGTFNITCSTTGTGQVVLDTNPTLLGTVTVTTINGSTGNFTNIDTHLSLHDTEISTQ